MHAAGMLVPPLTNEHGDSRNEGQLWGITHDKVEQFMPGFMKSIVPLSPEVVSSSADVSTTAAVTTEKLDLPPPPPPPDVVEPRKTATDPIGGTSIS